MIEVLFARLQQLTNKLRRIANHTTQNTYGNGGLGSWYLGIDPGTGDPMEVSGNYDKEIALSSGGVYNMPFYPVYDFRNLTVEEGTTLRFQGDSAVIRVKDTLRLNGVIQLSNCHATGEYNANGGSLNTYMEMMGSVKILPDAGVIRHVATTSGGFTIIYYNALLNQYGNAQSGLNWDAHTLNAGGTGGFGGGYLVLIAKKVLMGETGYLDVRGGNGSGAGASGPIFSYNLREIDL